MKTLIYLFRRYKAASLLNILGIALALLGCYVLLTQIYFIKTFNHGISDHENIYRIECKGVIIDDWFPTLCRPLSEKISQLPNVESIAILDWPVSFMADKDGTSISVKKVLVNNDFFSTFGAQCLDGTLTNFPNESDVIIPESFAMKFFGTVNATGKQISLIGYKPLNVVGVYKDFPENCLLSNVIYGNLGDKNNGNAWNFITYLRVKPGTDTQSLPSQIRSSFIDLFECTEEDLAENNFDVKILSLEDVYFDGHNPDTDRGNKTVLLILELSVFLLIIVSVINFANYSMSQAPMRLRNINTRKVMGESTLSLRLNLILEGVLISLIGFVLAMFLVYCLSISPSLGQYVLGSLSLPDNIGITLTIFSISILNGILSTVYSSIYLTSFQPAMVLKGGFGLSPRGQALRKTLIGLQFVIAFIMVIFICVIYSQSFFINNSDYGYDKDALLFGALDNIPAKDKNTLEQEISKINGVENVAFSNTNLGVYDMVMSWGREKDGKYYSFYTIPVQWTFLRTCGIHVVEGRDFNESDGNVFIINKAMTTIYPDISLDRPFIDEDDKVVGVCENVRIFTTHEDNNHMPVVFMIYGDKYSDWADYRNSLYIRLAKNTDKFAIRNQVNEIFKNFSIGSVDSDFKFIDESLEVAYHDENVFMFQMRMSTILTFIITLIGVFCLTMFDTEYRRKEIAIRKVLGSSVLEILKLFVSRYFVPLLVSFVIASPIAYYLCSNWLQNFAEHTPIYWWIFPLAFVIVAVLVIITVIVQSYRVATMNPVDSIKTE